MKQFFERMYPNYRRKTCTLQNKKSSFCFEDIAKIVSIDKFFSNVTSRTEFHFKMPCGWYFSSIKYFLEKYSCMDFKWNSPLCASTLPLRWSDFFFVRSRIPPPQNTPFEDRKTSGCPLSNCFSSIEVHFWHFSRLCPVSIDLTALHFAVLHFHIVLYWVQN